MAIRTKKFILNNNNINPKNYLFMKKITSLFAALFCVAMFANADIIGTINNAIPEGWSYITNNEKYPNPSFYGDGGLKMNFENMGIASPVFTATASVEVVLTINALNQNTKTPTSEDVFTITGLNASGSTVATATLKSVAKGDNSATLAGEGITQVKVIMTGYPSDGTKYCNVNLGGVKLIGVSAGEGGDDPTTKELVPEYAEANYFGTDWQILMDDSDEEGLGASFIMYLDFFNESATQIAGTWKNFDAKYTALYTIAGTDTTLVDYTDLTLELTWMQTIDMSDIYEGYTQCGVYKINVNYTGADNVLYTIKDAILPIFTLDYSGEVADFINVTDALEDVEAMNIRVADGAIMLNADAPVQVYSVSGQLLYFATAKGEMTINGMPKNQALIVRIGDKAAKVIL